MQSINPTISQDTTTATVTNTFTPAGHGLTVNLRTGGRTTLAPSSLSYELTCDNGFTDRFDLAPGEAAEFTAGQVPQGTQCTLAESGDSATRTTKDGRQYPISNTAEYLYAADAGGSKDVGATGQFTIGKQSTMDVHHEYDLILSLIHI